MTYIRFTLKKKIYNTKHQKLMFIVLDYERAENMFNNDVLLLFFLFLKAHFGITRVI